MITNESYKIERKKRKKPEINMAPMIDMVFQLIIFFMVTTSLAQQTGIQIEKPKAVSSQLLPRKNIVITISKEGEICLEDKKLSWEEFKKNLKVKIESSPESMVVIATDLDSKVGIVVNVMDEAKRFGAQRLSIATEYEKWEE
ncbi:MAG: biopolymer transporter ExbD [Elusimicrobiota bacterium]